MLMQTTDQRYLDYTIDAEPSLKGNWTPLDIQRFTAEVASLQRTKCTAVRSPTSLCTAKSRSPIGLGPHAAEGLT